MNEDIPPESSYPYFWSPASDISIDDFIAKYRPSMVQNDGSKPWLWVQASGATYTDDETRKAAVEEARALLVEYTGKIEGIKNDNSIPVRSNKKTGAKSKKEVREQLQAEAADKLKAIATKHNYFTGKWLIFASPDKVDLIWAALAKSLVSGPLSPSSVRLAKVSTTPHAETTHYQHVICLYLPNVYDKEDVTSVMKTLLRSHGSHLNGVKSDLYTLIGLDSKHSSGIQSTIWKNTALMSDVEIKELRDAFFAEVGTGKVEKPAGKTLETEEDKSPEEAMKKAKPRLKPKLKKVEDDPFASDDEPNAEDEHRRKLELQLKKGQKRPSVEGDDDFPKPAKKKTRP